LLHDLPNLARFLPGNRGYRQRWVVPLQRGQPIYDVLGCQITRNIFSEIGYRYLSDDFRDTNFTVGLKF
jgi:hypothetical protein